jgi:hypothetical protein
MHGSIGVGAVQVLRSIVVPFVRASSDFSIGQFHPHGKTRQRSASLVLEERMHSVHVLIFSNSIADE